MATWLAVRSVRQCVVAQPTTAGTPFNRGRRQFLFVASSGSAGWPSQPIQIPWYLLLLGFILLAGGCAAQDNASSTLTVAAAANVGPAFEEIGRRFKEDTGIEPTFVFGSTGTLAQQLANGAPFDVFAAADERTIQELTDQGLVQPGSSRSYAQGRLALVVNRASGLEVSTLSDLASPAVQRIAIANPEHAPYGQAAQEALINAGLWPAVQEKLVWAENVRQALQFVQTGDAPAGLVALSIARVPEVDVTDVPTRLHAPIDQAIVVNGRSGQQGVAMRFVEYVTGPIGREILMRYGYQVPEES